MYTESGGKRCLLLIRKKTDMKRKNKQQRKQVLTTSLGKNILQSTEKGDTRWPA